MPLVFVVAAWLPSADAGAARPDDAILARQAALDRAGFSPGVIDGVAGAKMTLAVREFQASHGLAVTGGFDARTLAALGVEHAPLTVEYRITAADLRDIGPVPRGWKAKAGVDRLRYESLLALLAERGHCKSDVVRRLNPHCEWKRRWAGDSVVLPNVTPQRVAEPVAAIEVDLGQKVVRAKDGHGHTIARFPCSIARFAAKRPRGTACITSVAFDPEYRFKPAMWPEVHGIPSDLRIPPGPRNPVGLCWIGLSLPGYGIHGTPNPELIGKTGSHGCIRLTNWDAVRLGRMVRVGTPVRFVAGESAAAPAPGPRAHVAVSHSPAARRAAPHQSAVRTAAPSRALRPAAPRPAKEETPWD